MAIAISLAVVAFVVFSPGLFGPFLWDDTALILGNAQVRTLSAWRLWFTKDFWDVSPELLDAAPRLHYFRPLVTASYALEFHLVGGRPFLFHLDNLLAHSVASVLAFFALRRWTDSLVPATLGAVFFALHPTKAESVAWIAGRTDVLCAIFVLVATAGVGLRLRGRRVGLAFEIVGTVLAYLTKEGAVVLPAFVALEAWVALGRPAVDLGSIRRMVRAALPQLGIALVYLAAHARWMPLRPKAPRIAPWDHVLFVSETLGRYVTLAFAPHDLSGQHGLIRTFEGRPVHSGAYALLGVFALLALFMLAWSFRKRAPMITMGIALFAAVLVPVSNLVLAGIATLVAERFLYLPLLGVALFIAGLVELARGRARDATVIGCAAVALVSLAAITLDRALDFSDEARFWDHERALHPESLEALRMRIRRAKQARRYPEAEALANEGLAIASKWYAHTGDGVEFMLQLAEVRALLTPDLAVESLNAIDAFYRTVLDPEAQIAALRIPTLSFTLPLKGPVGDRARALRLNVLCARAEVDSRLGRDPEALALIDQARASCVTCKRVAVVGAMVAARAGEYAKARLLLASSPDQSDDAVPVAKALDAAELAHRQAALASGPVALQLAASELAALEAWGRAYHVLSPFRAQIELAPGFAIGFAELAYRAGDTDVARGVLEKHVPAEKIGPLMDQWAIKMGWR